MLFCPKCDNILDISKTQPKVGKNPSIIPLETPDTVSSSESEYDSENENSDVDEKPTLEEKERKLESDAKELDNSKIEEILSKIANDEKLNDVDFSEYKMEQFIKNKAYTSMERKKKIAVHEKLVSIFDKLEDVTSAFYICKNCSYSKPIGLGTLISSKMGIGASGTYMNLEKLKNRAYCKMLPLTRNYICPNTSCKSHKDHSKREAAFFRIGENLQVWYVCRECNEYWKGE